MLDAVVGFALIHSQLLAPVGQREEAQMVVETHLVYAMLTLYLAVVTRRSDPDALVPCPSSSCSLLLFPFFSPKVSEVCFPQPCVYTILQPVSHNTDYPISVMLNYGQQKSVYFLPE